LFQEEIRNAEVANELDFCFYIPALPRGKFVIIWIGKLLPREVLLLSTCSTIPAGLISQDGGFLLDTVMMCVTRVLEVKVQDKSLNASIASTLRF
jgi:hypothetical protein